MINVIAIIGYVVVTLQLVMILIVRTTMSRHYCKEHKKEYQGMCADCIYEFGTTE